MEMKMNPLFPKKRKKTRDEVILDLDIQLRRLEDQYNVIINRELRAVRAGRAQNRENPKAVTKIKNAYYGMGIIKQAQENLREVRTGHELCQTMNEMGAALKVLNRLSNNSERIHRYTINRGIEKMNANADRRDGGMDNVFKTSINDLVSDDIVERLLSGEKVSNCLAGDSGSFMNMPFSPELMAEIEGMNFENAGLESDLNATMAYVNALESEI